MTVLTDSYKKDHIGDGVTVEFSYDFRIFRADEVVVSVNGGVTNDYIISGLGDVNGGLVTFNTAPADQATIRIARDIPFTQLVDYRPHDPFPAETHEAALDRIVMMIQQLGGYSEEVIRSTIEGLYAPAYVAGEYWRWSTTAQEIVTGVPVANTLDTATDQEIIDGTDTVAKAISPAQVKLGVETHTPYTIENVATLPGTPDPNTIYLVDE